MKSVIAITALVLLAACSPAPEPEEEITTTLEDGTEQAVAEESVAEVEGAVADDTDAATTAAEIAEVATQVTSPLAALTTGLTIDKSDPNWKLTLPMPAKLSFDTEDEIFWMLSTNLGDMKFRLFPNVAPMHVTSTLYLTELGFYDDVIFHRIIPQFMAQGGDPLGRGNGGPGYEYDGEFAPDVKHDRPGLLSMANRGPGTDGSQFFITFVPTPWLDGKHTIFGEIVEGMEVIAKMEQLGSRSGATSERVVIEKASYDWQ